MKTSSSSVHPHTKWEREVSFTQGQFLWQRYELSFTDEEGGGGWRFINSFEVQVTSDFKESVSESTKRNLIEESDAITVETRGLLETGGDTQH